MSSVPAIYDEDKTILKHNVLIEGHYPAMDIREHRVIALTAAQMSKDDEDFKKYHIPIKHITKSNKLYSYEETKKFSEKLLSRTVDIAPYKDQELDEDEKAERENKKKKNKKNKREFKLTKFFIQAHHVEGQGGLEVQFHPDMKPYFLYLKEKFTTRMKLKYLLKLSSSYSYRLYELLKQYENTKTKTRYFSLNVLRKHLGITEETAPVYAKYFGNLKKNVIDKAQKELKQHTDIRFTYKVENLGRKAVGVKFFIHKNTNGNEAKDITPSKNDFSFLDLKEEKVNQKIYNHLVTHYGKTFTQDEAQLIASNLEFNEYDSAYKKMNNARQKAKQEGRELKNPGKYLKKVLLQILKENKGEVDE